MKTKQHLLSFFFICSFHFCTAQIEVAHVSIKEFKAIGFGGFLNFSVPVSEAHYLTIEGGLQYFKNKDDEDAGLFPVLLGYRYTINKSGTGLYLEPTAGYTFGGTRIGVYENDAPLSDGNGNWLYEKIAGPTSGIGLGYLFEPGGKVQFNIALRYQHSFGSTATNVLALRVSHALSFGKRYE